MQRFPTEGLEGRVQQHGHHDHRTLPLWTFLWGYINEKLYSIPVPHIDTLKAMKRDALVAETEEMLEKARTEIEHRLNVFRATNGAHVEVYYVAQKKST
jgi:hypothetical protein